MTHVPGKSKRKGANPITDAMPTVAPTPGPTITLAMIAAECDASTLGAAIASAADLVDKVIVVVDHESIEAAKAASKAGAKVKSFKWCNDFAAARNEALAHCNTDWVLVLDADEVLDPLTPAAIAGLYAQLTANPAIFLLTVTSAQANGSPVLNDTPRLFPNRMTVKYHGALHETPQDTTGELVNQHLPLLTITHAGYTPDAMERGNKTSRNLDILNGMIANEPINPQYRLFASQALFEIEPEAAADQCRVALHCCKIFPDVSAGCYDQAAADLLCILAKSGHNHQALAEADVIMQWREPAHAGFWANLSNCQYAVAVATKDRTARTAMHHRAAASAHRAMEFRDARTQQNDRAAITWLPDVLLGTALAQLERDDEAIACLERAMAMNPPHHREWITDTLHKLKAARVAGDKCRMPTGASTTP